MKLLARLLAALALLIAAPAFAQTVVPYTFANQTGRVPASELDADFAFVLHADNLNGTLPQTVCPLPTPTLLGCTRSAAAQAHEWIDSISALGTPHQSQPDFSDLTGTSCAGPLNLATAYIRCGAGVPAVNDPIGSIDLQTDGTHAYLMQWPTSPTPTFVQSKVAAQTFTVLLGSAPTANDVLIATCYGNGAQPTVITGAGWISLATHNGTGAADPYAVVAGLLVGAGASATQTPCTTGSSTAVDVAVTEVSGMDPTITPSVQMVQFAGNNVTSGAVTASVNGTTTAPNTLGLIFGGGYSIQSAPGYTQSLGGSAWTNSQSVSAPCCTATSVLSGSLAFAPNGSSVTATTTDSNAGAGINHGETVALVLLQAKGGPHIGYTPFSLLSSIKSAGTQITGDPRTLNFGTGLTATDDGFGNTTVSIGAGGGSMTLISSVTTAGSQTSVTFSSIPGTYSHLMLVAYGRSATAAFNDDGWIRFNGDTGSNYSRQYLIGSGSSVSAGQDNSVNHIAGLTFSAASATANFLGVNTVTIYGYAATTFNKMTISEEGFANSLGSGQLGRAPVAGVWNSTAAITSITIVLASGAAFVNGSMFSLYGLP